MRSCKGLSWDRARCWVRSRKGLQCDPATGLGATTQRARARSFNVLPCECATSRPARCSRDHKPFRTVTAKHVATVTAKHLAPVAAQPFRTVTAKHVATVTAQPFRTVAAEHLETVTAKHV